MAAVAWTLWLLSLASITKLLLASLTSNTVEVDLLRNGTKAGRDAVAVPMGVSHQSRKADLTGYSRDDSGIELRSSMENVTGNRFMWNSSASHTAKEYSVESWHEWRLLTENQHSATMSYKILLYVPNVIGYVRLFLVAASWITFSSKPFMSAAFYIVSAALDCVDGYSARKLEQTSTFGAWFDVVIDNVSRGMLWSRLYSCGYLVACVEWLCFVCTHTLGAQWKSTPLQQPWLVSAVMANNYRTPFGVASIAGIHVLPIVLYTHHTAVLSSLGIALWLQYSAIVLLAAGRALCMFVELWYIWFHVVRLLEEDNTTEQPKHHN